MNYLAKYFLFFVSILACSANASESPSVNSAILAQNKLAKLESAFKGKIGIYAIDTNNNQVIAYRSDERFPIQSTLKFMGVAALLKLSESNQDILKEKIRYSKKDLNGWHPISRKYVNSGMTIAAMAEASMSYSDNPAMNLILKRFGGPKFSTEFAHSIGNNSYNLIHYDGADLNTDPSKKEDTATPKDMAISVQKILLGNVLSASHRSELTTWMTNNTTGYKRIRAGVPIGWTVADKTGSGDNGIANDIGIVSTPFCKPVVLAIYTIQNKKDAPIRDDIVAAATSIILDEFTQQDHCFDNM